MTKRQPNEQREQKPNLFGLCRVASEEEVFNPQLLTLLTVGIYRTHLYIDVHLVAHGLVPDSSPHSSFLMTFAIAPRVTHG